MKWLSSLLYIFVIIGCLTLAGCESWETYESPKHFQKLENQEKEIIASPNTFCSNVGLIMYVPEPGKVATFVVPFTDCDPDEN
jgi:hypothetical protein